MRVYNYNLNGGSLTVTVDENAGTIVSIDTDESNAISLPEGSEEEAVAALALAVDRAIHEEVHDEESGVITIRSAASAWNTPAYIFRTIKRH